MGHMFDSPALNGPFKAYLMIFIFHVSFCAPWWSEPDECSCEPLSMGSEPQIAVGVNVNPQVDVPPGTHLLPFVDGGLMSSSSR